VRNENEVDRANKKETRRLLAQESNATFKTTRWECMIGRPLEQLVVSGRMKEPNPFRQDSQPKLRGESGGVSWGPIKKAEERTL